MILTNVPLAVPSVNSPFLHSVLVVHTILREKVCYFHNNINILVFIRDMKCVLCEGENECFYRIYATANPQI